MSVPRSNAAPSRPLRSTSSLFPGQYDPRLPMRTASHFDPLPPRTASHFDPIPSRLPMRTASQFDPSLMAHTAMQYDPARMAHTAMQFDPSGMARTAMQFDPSGMARTAMQFDPSGMDPARTASQFDPRLLPTGTASRYDLGPLYESRRGTASRFDVDPYAAARTASHYGTAAKYGSSFYDTARVGKTGAPFSDAPLLRNSRSFQ